MTNRASGAAYPAVNTGDFLNAEVLYPSVQLITEYQDVVSNMHEEKHILNRKNELLREARDLLLPRLVSGQLDVGDVEVEMGDST